MKKRSRNFYVQSFATGARPCEKLFIYIVYRLYLLKTIYLRVASSLEGGYRITQETITIRIEKKRRCLRRREIRQEKLTPPPKKKKKERTDCINVDSDDIIERNSIPMFHYVFYTINASVAAFCIKCLEGKMEFVRDVFSRVSLEDRKMKI